MIVALLVIDALTLLAVLAFVGHLVDLGKRLTAIEAVVTARPAPLRHHIATNGTSLPLWDREAINRLGHAVRTAGDTEVHRG